MKALVLILDGLEYRAVSISEGWRLVDAGLAVWPAGLGPDRPVETATAEAREKAVQQRRHRR